MLRPKYRKESPGHVEPEKIRCNFLVPLVKPSRPQASTRKLPTAPALTEIQILHLLYRILLRQ